jgi:hypothetical protein
MLEAQQNCEKQTRTQKSCTVLGIDQGEDEDSVQEAIVLEVDMVDDEEAGGEKDRQSGCMGCVLRS